VPTVTPLLSRFGACNAPPCSMRSALSVHFSKHAAPRSTEPSKFQHRLHLSQHERVQSAAAEHKPHLGPQAVKPEQPRGSSLATWRRVGEIADRRHEAQRNGKESMLDSTPGGHLRAVKPPALQVPQERCGIAPVRPQAGAGCTTLATYVADLRQGQSLEGRTLMPEGHPDLADLGHAKRAAVIEKM
jgi:hypothetical protein